MKIVATEVNTDNSINEVLSNIETSLKIIVPTIAIICLIVAVLGTFIPNQQISEAFKQHIWKIVAGLLILSFSSWFVGFALSGF